MKKKIFKAYIVWSVCADVFAISGITYFLFW